MSLSSSTLKSMILGELQSRGYNINNPRKDSAPWIDRFAEAIAVAVVNHITQSAEVQTDSGAPDSEHHGTVY